jgi:glycosyltransferase involved in cell wall biosynthesis
MDGAQSVSGSRSPESGAAGATAVLRSRPRVATVGRAGPGHVSRAPAKRLRILIITDTALLTSGGSERFLRNLLVRLPAAAFEVDVLQLAEPPADAFGSFDAPNVTLSHRPVRSRLALLAVIAHVYRLVRRNRYDIVHSQHESADLVNALVPGAARRLSSRRDMGFLKSNRMRWLMRRLDRRFDCIVAPSQAILDTLPCTREADRVCIPNGVDTMRYAPADPLRRARMREALGYAPNELLVGCVANFNPVKRHADLIDAFARVYARLPQARLLLLGDGRLRGAIETRIAALGLTGAVRLLGERLDVANVLPALDLFALASESEGMSNAILEAQACALPVVATRVGGNPELVQPDCGVLVEPGNPPAFAEAVLELLPDAARRSKLGAAARSRVCARHSLRKMADAYLALYRELADAR